MVENVYIVKGHHETEELKDLQFDTSEPFSKKRSFPPNKADLECDLNVLKKLQENEYLTGALLIEGEIKKALESRGINETRQASND